jgi:hypothetical protein
MTTRLTARANPRDWSVPLESLEYKAGLVRRNEVAWLAVTGRRLKNWADFASPGHWIIARARSSPTGARLWSYEREQRRPGLITSLEIGDTSASAAIAWSACHDHPPGAPDRGISSHRARRDHRRERQTPALIPPPRRERATIDKNRLAQSVDLAAAAERYRPPGSDRRRPDVGNPPPGSRCVLKVASRV